MYGVQTTCQSPALDKQVNINNGPFFQGVYVLVLEDREGKDQWFKNSKINNNFTYKEMMAVRKTKQDKEMESDQGGQRNKEDRQRRLLRFDDV